ncbi:MAG: bifunctional UDP-3-O-[3-hydroxymyristoyl] N-acetylglucosamine deacetylase/3-hydroxyacyl-ACP dehydratase [Candidatus Amulumruptor caecigallinarius]|nr:bifunctional UDP-3-O-[3-hydroxymyristoyl] N-acetylglucosamine deacetylase/3-hydroxyacyl-ACP dehydratase [Candidatus Amulumruptor caecigallinarius]MCM1396737.1 bifunctional UDP-3-O-[3-hydroxymyristoyl] N-acetylglucosamine deacetylase/3-hydroxyacyl-ACP dehydratase [Candidatus Amulumruptor caecigallinarius]MCM1453205.1 bifunctional UDP-3-O-[3-hydroxymyristoyl] N-acetylglucosamine deacetylase/3-hydroxyacyl-ACP dehydratase [bacterium]
MKQITLKAPFSVSGKGLHTGAQITATFNPAPEGTGYKFRRTDLDGAPEVDAVAENVVSTDRGTTVTKGEASVSTIEHAMAALYAAGIDNCIIELNGAEMPILDGSSREYVEKIAACGLDEQNADKEFYIVRQRMELKDEATGASIVVLPDDHFSLDVMVDFDSPVLSNQYAALESLDSFATEVSGSRTFVFVREVEPLLKAGLIKGGDLDNAIVVYDREMPQSELDRLADLMNVPRKDVSEFGYINNRPLAYANEPARHKLLDVIGDLALIGRPLRGKVIATRPGHTINTTFAKKVRKELKRQEVQAPVYDPNKPALLDNNQIRDLLPHRYPFLLIDKIIERGTNYIVGVKNVTTNEPFFQGHFPQEPVMPGVLQVEAMAQTGGILVLSQLPDPEHYSTYFMKIDNVKFRQKVVPGDTLLFHVSFMTELRRGCAVMKGYAFVGDKIVTECEFMAQIIKNK